MIAFNFDYVRPSTLKEAVDAHRQLSIEGKNPVYYAGGSETITMCRAGDIRPGAVIDIKRIPELMGISEDQNALSIGAACTLYQISRANLFPLLTLACGRIADHTNQCRITLGGNLCGTILYRETSLPLFLADAQVALWGPDGARSAAFQSVFDGRMRLKPGEMITRVNIPAWALTARHFHIKKTANEKIDYPLLSASVLFKDGDLRAAFSGVCESPFRAPRMEAALNDRTKSIDERAALAASLLPSNAITTAQGTGEYRIFVLKNTLKSILEETENG